MPPTNPGTAVYDLDYFDPCQMFLYIGDTWVDEVTSLSYETQQGKTPIYGYASQMFDDLAAGQVIVNGTFTINFKEQGYIWAVLRRYRQMSLDVTNTSGQSGAIDALMRAGQDNPIVWNGNNHSNIFRESIERQVEGFPTRGQEYRAYVEMAGYATSSKKIKGKPQDKRFANLMDVYENQVWNGASTDDLTNQIRRPDCNVFDGFQIYVVFGNYNSLAANHTVQRIDNVALTSQGKVIRMGDSPIQEAYTFLAQTTY
jgi:hypothetical protein